MPPEQAMLLAAQADARLAGLGAGLAVLATEDPPRLRRAALALGARPGPRPALPGQCLIHG
jgi:hypothetical protein